MKQEIAFKILSSGKNVFLTGSAGTGKTYVINQYVEYLRERGIEPAIVAPTGIALHTSEAKPSILFLVWAFANISMTTIYVG